MERLGEGRMAEVFALDAHRVVKLDRVEWNGVSRSEERFLQVVHAAGLPVPSPYGLVTIDGRCGMVMERLSGGSLGDVIEEATPTEVDALAERFATLHVDLNSVVVDGLPDLVDRLGPEVDRSGLPPATIEDLRFLLAALDCDQRRVCHFDLHPSNVMVTPRGWTVIDWLGAASGPPGADFARTLVLSGDATSAPMVRFIDATRRYGQRVRRMDNQTCQTWMRIVAAARLAEGLDGAHADWLRGVATRPADPAD